MTPEPLVPPEVDLRTLPYMPLDVVRLRDCETALIASGEGFRAAVMLWCASWHQIPAASLPSDERALTHLAGLGRDVASWRAIREEALRGFIECSDGRLYHPTVAEKALEAWESRKKFMGRLEKARAAKAAKAEEAVAVAPIIEPIKEPVIEPINGLKGRGSEGEGEGYNISNNLIDCSVASPAPRKASRAKLRTQISEDAQPCEKDRASADEAGLTAEQFRTEWRRFRDYHKAKGSLMADWSAAWRTWLGNASQFQRAPPSRAGPLSGQCRNGLGAIAMEMVEDERRRRQEANSSEVFRLLSVDDGQGRSDCETGFDSVFGAVAGRQI